VADPVLVGTVTLDVLHEGPIGAGIPPVTLRWGGVMNNTACALGMRGADPLLVTARYTGELAAAVSHHLAGNRVRWHPLPVVTPLPLFHARLVDGSVQDKLFLGDDALTSLTPEVLDKHRSVFDTASVVAAGTDSDEATLAWLADVAVARGVPFWLLSADPTEVGKLRPFRRPAALVATNLRELALWQGGPLTDRAAVVAAARRLAAPAGRCLVTLGAAGALLVSADEDRVLFEPAPSVDGLPVAVGAGDVMFGCLLAARLAGLDWARALREASTLTGVFLRGGESGSPYLPLRKASSDEDHAT
jgi:sugar/nucleoside kinase (ribokinase family)